MTPVPKISSNNGENKVVGRNCASPFQYLHTVLTPTSVASKFLKNHTASPNQTRTTTRSRPLKSHSRLMPMAKTYQTTSNESISFQKIFYPMDALQPSIYQPTHTSQIFASENCAFTQDWYHTAECFYGTNSITPDNKLNSL